MKPVVIILLLASLLSACAHEAPKRANNEAISGVVAAMTDLMVHDITNPPLAARFFSYACLSGYEVVAQNNAAYKSMHGVLKNFPLVRKPAGLTNYETDLAALIAMLHTAQKMQPSGADLRVYEQRVLDSVKSIGLDEDVIANSVAYGDSVSKQILAYAKADGYNRTTNFARYTPATTEGSWYPTPPAFIAAIEPHFNAVRPYTLDTCNQFLPAPPVTFSKAHTSDFYKLMRQNYDLQLTDSQRAIAAFWDCNPFAVQDNGHLLIGLKKISPGAHWLGITGIACKQQGVDFAKAMAIFTCVSVGLMDAFICCWDEKYRSNRIRPETAIRKYIDPAWEPLIQTPPFPEYLSGHSVISAASATILSHYFGNRFSYTDTVENRYGLPARHFNSFSDAAAEAGLSRFYGGIHFMDAVDNGLDQGAKVGAWVLEKTAPMGGGAALASH